MQDWQKDRNYRKYENPDGSLTCIITVDGEDVEVSLEIYTVYSQADRRERYVEESEEGLLLSLDRMDEDGTQLSYLTEQHVESAEDTAHSHFLIEHVRDIWHLLPEDDRELVRRLYFDGVSIRKYAKEKGLSDFTIRYRERRLLEKIRKYLEI